MSGTEWLLFVAQLPATPSSLRVNVWRRLRGAGAASLQNGVWILPVNEENTTFMQRLLGYIVQNEASGQIFVARELNEAIQADILTRFEADRAQDYGEFQEQCEAFMAEIEKETEAGKFTYAELEENEQDLQKLVSWLEKIQKRDFMGGEKAQQAAEALQACRDALEAFTAQVYKRYTS